MANGTLAPSPKFTGLDDNGNPLSAGKLYTYAAGTTTPLATWPQVTLTPGQENANPIILDAAGRATIFLSPTSYKFILKTSADVTIWTQDNIGAVPATNIDTDVNGEAGEDLTATQVAYLNATTWFKADADATTSSTLPIIAFVVADTATGVDGTFRTAGRMDGFSGLTPGAAYYVSATGGSITSTAPTNARYVGHADSITSLIIAPNPRPVDTPALVGPLIKTLCNGRLSLTTAVPVTIGDVTAAATLYWVPYQGNEVAIYSGTAWVAFPLAELSIAAPTGANQVADVFLNYNSGTPALQLTNWTNDTTRATALTTQDGILVKSGATTHRYVGTVRTVTASQLNDSFALRHVWNYYHRLPRQMRVVEATDTWSYNTATWRQANAGAANQLSFVIGVAEVPLQANVHAMALNAGGAAAGFVAVGLDSTTAPTAGNIGRGSYSNATLALIHQAELQVYPAVGYHFAAWLERGDGTGTQTWYGDNGDNTLWQSGIFGSIDG